MKAVVVYESLTGNTRRAAEMIGERLPALGHDVLGVFNVTAVDLQTLSAAELVVVGSWVDGFFFVGQRPGRAARLWHLPAIAGKQAVVYCTYAINPGKTLDKMTAIVGARGGNVLGGLALHRGHLQQDVVDFCNRVQEAVAST
jgi:hypothetical protein